MSRSGRGVVTLPGVWVDNPAPANVSPGLEAVVRPFVMLESNPRTVRPKRPPLPGEETEAFLSWGKASTFTEAPVDPSEIPPETPPGQHWQPADFELEKDKDKDKELLTTWTETSRETKKVRVENPDDPDQYVIVRRIEAVEFSSDSTSRKLRLVFQNRD